MPGMPLSVAGARAIESRCAEEPIHIPGSIQPHGILLAADPARDLALVAVSANAATLPGAGPDPLGRSLVALLGADFAVSLGRRARAGALDPQSPWTVALTLPGPASFDVVCHAHDGLVLIELEAADPADVTAAADAIRRVQQAVARLRAETGGLEALAMRTVESIRRITGFDRVLMYRFDPDWNGQAIAEDQVRDWPQRLIGLHFPASDIPAQARELYRTSLMRSAPVRDAEPVPLLYAPGRVAPIDLSYARLRTLSPIHLQYHANMGVDGTMSLSVIDTGRLWGLVVCHHRTPHRMNASQRAAAAAITDAFALRLDHAERVGTEQGRHSEQGRVASLIAHLARVDDMHAALTSGDVTLRDMFGAGGAAVVQGERVTTIGATPARPDIVRIADWLRRHAAPGPIFATENLAGMNPAFADVATVASGVLALFLTDDRAQLLLWFRPEEPHEVGWGGDPHKNPRAAMVPRASFERWVERRRGYARRWHAWELEAAALLRAAITEVIGRSLRRITELSEQLRQSQKMEAVGQLTGGLAHDFNNMLGGISGALELAQKRLEQGRADAVPRYLATAAQGVERAAALTHRLLAFSRRQTLDPRPTDVNRLVRSMQELIGRTVGPAIEVACETDRDAWTVLCDPNQLENAILNLALNGRDAMEGGGRLTLATENAVLDEAFAGQSGVLPGDYACISVSDTGHGMDSETMARAFDPFFTTKPTGQGTGLGLSMVYGFARQSGGLARLASAPDEGTTVRLYLPRYTGPVPAEPPVLVTTPAPVPAGHRTVLVVDDEPVLRMLLVEVLEEQGYRVLQAGDGKQALAQLRANAAIDLLLTDIGLPGGMHGRAVAEAARAIIPDLKVLFMTGYAENSALLGSMLDSTTQVMTKPFTMQALLLKVRSIVSG